MARTTADNVRAIIEVDSTVIVVDADLDPFIEIANELVTEQCVTNGPSTAYSSTRLELIERWLAAHFYTNRDPRPVNEEAGPVGVTYQSKVDLGFDTSHYGQTAMRLDTNGKLAALNDQTKKGGKITATAVWLGTTTPPGSY